MQITFNKRRNMEGVSMVLFILVIVLIVGTVIVTIAYHLSAILNPPPPPPPNNGTNNAVSMMGVTANGYYYVTDRHVTNLPGIQAASSLNSPAPTAYPVIGMSIDSNGVICLSLVFGAPSSFTNTTLSGMGFTFDSYGYPSQNPNWTPASADQVQRYTDSTLVNLSKSDDLVNWTFIQSFPVPPGGTNFYIDQDPPNNACFYRANY